MTRVAIVGAGLTGLATGYLLAERGIDVKIFEARTRPGGRIASMYEDDGVYLADLGPTWVWPMYQPVLIRWCQHLGVELYPQFEEGDALLDFGPGQQPERFPLIRQDGNTRILGGPERFINCLLALLPHELLNYRSPLFRVEARADEIWLWGLDGQSFGAFDHVVLTIPPRLLIESVQFEPELPSEVEQALKETPTWMAQQSKVVVTFEHAFWREWGLSGRIASKVGPLFEVHDHCGPGGIPPALFGFVGWSLEQRRQYEDEFADFVLAQLRRVFGPGAPEPIAIAIQDWATQPYTTSMLDIQSEPEHPEIRPEILRQPVLDDRLFFACSELSTVSPGLIEGAFSAAEHVASFFGEAET